MLEVVRPYGLSHGSGFPSCACAQDLQQGPQDLSSGPHWYLCLGCLWRERYAWRPHRINGEEGQRNVCGYEPCYAYLGTAVNHIVCRWILSSRMMNVSTPRGSLDPHLLLYGPTLLSVNGRKMRNPVHS